MHRWLSLSFVFMLACASERSSRPATLAQPSIEPRLTNAPFFGSSDSAPAAIQVTIQNRAAVAIKVRRIEVDSPGMTTYTLNRVIRDIRETLQPGEARTYSIIGTVRTIVDRPSEPLALRAIVEFEAQESVWREIVMRR